MLGDIARKLRIFGYDTLYIKDTSDSCVLQTALREKRILLTRDKELFKRVVKSGIQGILLEKQDETENIAYTLLKYKIHCISFNARTARCSLCNGILRVRTSTDVKGSLPGSILKINRSPELERTVNKVLTQRQEEFIVRIDSAHSEALSNLESSRSTLRSEYDQIIQSSKKQAENLKRQILGSKRITSRNEELLLVESAVDHYFEKAKERLRDLPRDKDYKVMINEMIEDCSSAISSQEIIIECSEKDLKLVSEAIGKKSRKVKLSLSDKPITIIGGLRARSADGSLMYDSTLDSRAERLKPLIRKAIVQTLRGDK